jgi:hypothetical protein
MDMKELVEKVWSTHKSTGIGIPDGIDPTSHILTCALKSSLGYGVPPAMIQYMVELGLLEKGIGYALTQDGENLLDDYFTSLASNTERIICSAIWYKDLKLENPDALSSRGFRPYNCDRGIVFSGWRHPNCLYQMVSITGLKSHEAGEAVQGFLTNKNRFVDRKEGAEIALASNQVLRLKYSKTMLYSEDLY